MKKANNKRTIINFKPAINDGKVVYKNSIVQNYNINCDNINKNKFQQKIL